MSGSWPASRPTPTRRWRPRPPKRTGPRRGWPTWTPSPNIPAASWDDLGRLAGLTRRGRDQRRSLEDKLDGDTERAAAARHTYDEVAGRVAQLGRDQDAFERFERTEGWRRDDLKRLHDDLDHHWAQVVTSQASEPTIPLAFGIDKLRHARTTTARRPRPARCRPSPPTGPREWDQTRQQLPDILRARHDAEQALAERQAALQEAGRRRWGRHDHQAIAAARDCVAVAEQHLEQATAAERTLRERLDALAQYQQQRQQTITAAAPERQELETSLAQLDGCPRPHPLRPRPSARRRPPPHLVERLGSPPSSPAGRAVWCHHALAVEAVLDRNEGARQPTSRIQQTSRARQEIALADRFLYTGTDRSDPTGWAQAALHASQLVDKVHHDLRVRRTIDRLTTPTRGPQWTPDVGVPAPNSGPELGV